MLPWTYLFSFSYFLFLLPVDWECFLPMFICRVGFFQHGVPLWTRYAPQAPGTAVSWSNIWCTNPFQFLNEVYQDLLIYLMEPLPAVHHWSKRECLKSWWRRGFSTIFAWLVFSCLYLCNFLSLFSFLFFSMEAVVFLEFKVLMRLSRLPFALVINLYAKLKLKYLFFQKKTFLLIFWMKKGTPNKHPAQELQ